MSKVILKRQDLNPDGAGPVNFKMFVEENSSIR